MGAREWLAATSRFACAHLPPAPAAVLEIGCGSRGGVVPGLRRTGYAATGVDPEAPDGPCYSRIPFERYEPPQRVDAVVACVSLHHVADLEGAVEHVSRVLRPGGVVVVAEWAWERFDEATARWCFDRLVPGHDDPSWLHAHRDEWKASNQPWRTFQHEWGHQARLHTGESMVHSLADRVEPRLDARGPYLFRDLDGTAETDEQAAIDAGRIQATGIHFIGTRPA